MKFVIISFIVLFSLLTLAPNMQGAQFLKMGEVIEHFENDYPSKKLSLFCFFDFLKEHYSKKIDLDDDEHKDLPFKTLSTSVIQLSIVEFSIQPVIIGNSFEFHKKDVFSVSFFSDNQRLTSIWNPPRI